jgi:hypothetical protein
MSYRKVRKINRMFTFKRRIGHKTIIKSKKKKNTKNNRNLPSPNKAVHIEINTMRNVSDHIFRVFQFIKCRRLCIKGAESFFRNLKRQSGAKLYGTIGGKLLHVQL